MVVYSEYQFVLPKCFWIDLLSVFFISVKPVTLFSEKIKTYVYL